MGRDFLGLGVRSVGCFGHRPHVHHLRLFEDGLLVVRLVLHRRGLPQKQQHVVPFEFCRYSSTFFLHDYAKASFR